MRPTARVLVALAEYRDDPAVARIASRGIVWLGSSQNADGGWGGHRGAPSSIEETSLALDALLRWRGAAAFAEASAMRSTRAGLEWLDRATESGSQLHPSPIGFYFARLWYFEELYPLLFATAAFLRARQFTSETDHATPRATASATSM